ncbi:hypothetical protein DL96DRAFT_1595819 [Flagelloscypha sp. PMI_526]|nr:hypothetical protein DL96DRAFT_1595819 [Flagelloscypha sp. PMI_526]
MNPTTQDDQQKEMLAMLFPPGFPTDQLSPPSQDAGSGGAPPNTNFPFPSIDMLSNVLPQDQSQGQPQTYSNPQALLEQQIRLSQFQQLQQLQNQIFSNSQTPEMIREPPSPYHGLPTPGPSNELRAQSNSMDFVSPMMLDYMDPSRSRPQTHPEMQMDLMHQPLPPQHRPAPPPHFHPRSAPADIAFGGHPSDMDFDVVSADKPIGLDPITTMLQASSSDEMPAKKKHSPAVRPTTSTSTRSRASRSTNSTPLMHGRRASLIGVPGDTPSPVDLSMPPPASNGTPHRTEQTPEHNAHEHSILPVTPASIMNMSRPRIDTQSSSSNSAQDEAAKGRSPAKSRPSARTSARKASNASATAGSSQLKNILPVLHFQPSLLTATGGQPVKKTSHKAAEQKRRDAMKSTYDELRILLPPIPLPNSPSSPSSLPPRGPPKSGGDGPNKGVSKLQLLICAKQHIKTLNRRVERRDAEIDALRAEVRRLRLVSGSLDDWIEELDEVEKEERENASRMYLEAGEGGEDDDE